MTAVFVALGLSFFALCGRANILQEQHAPLRLTYYPGRDDCNPTYRPLRFSNVAFVVNCQSTMTNVEVVLQDLKTTNRKAILSDSFILSRSEADLAIYSKYAEVFAAFYAQDEPIWQAVSGTSTTPGEINENIDSQNTSDRVEAMIDTVARKIQRLKNITREIDTPESHVPVLVNEGKPILNMFDHNYNVHGGDNTSVWGNFTLHTVRKFHQFNLKLFKRLGNDFDWYGFDWYDSVNVSDNKQVVENILGNLRQMPNARNHRYVLFPFLIQDDFNKTAEFWNTTSRHIVNSEFNRNEFLMNKAVVDVALNKSNDVALLFVWTGTKEMSPSFSKTIEECERYLNTTPPAGFTFLETLGRVLDVSNEAAMCARDREHCGVPSARGSLGYVV